LDKFKRRRENFKKQEEESNEIINFKLDKFKRRRENFKKQEVGPKK